MTTGQTAAATAARSNTPTDSDNILERRLGDWRRRLLDLSYRNPLIKYTSGKSGSLEITSPSPHALLGRLDDDNPHYFYYPPEEEPSHPAEAESDKGDLAHNTPQTEAPGPSEDEIETTTGNRRELVRTLDSLARRSRSDYNDKGLRVLYLGAGFLHWHDKRRDEDLESPLVLVPVELRRNSLNEPYSLHILRDEDIVINPTLKTKIEADYMLRLPDEWDWEDKPLSEELEDVRQAFAGLGWTVSDRTVLSIFHFQKMVMFQDLKENSEAILDHPLIRSMALGRRRTPDHSRMKELPEAGSLDWSPNDGGGDNSVLDADSSQRRCIEAAKGGASFVMQGPPGTGKSQTITNIITEAIGEGKKVLFVSEKIAALDVVYKRLDEAGLGSLCLNLHGDKATRASVVRELATSLQRREESSPKAMASADLEELERTCRRLNTVAAKLHTPHPNLHGESIHRAFGELAMVQKAPVVAGAPTLEWDNPAEDIRRYKELLRLFRSAAGNWDIVTDPEHPWRGFGEPGLGSAETRGLRGRVEGLIEAAERLSQAAHVTATAVGFDQPPTFAELRRWLELGSMLADKPVIEEQALAAGANGRLREAVNEAEAAHDGLAGKIAKHRETYRTREPAGFPDRIGAGLAASLDSLEAITGRSNEWEDHLPQAVAAIADLCSAAAVDIHQLEADTGFLRQALGQPDGACSVRSALNLAELGRLAHAIEDRPDPGWLNRFNLEQAGMVIDEIGPKIERCQELTADIRSRYREDVFGLAIDDLLVACRAAAAKPLGRRRRAYREVRAELKAIRKDGQAPADPIADLEQVETLWRLHGEVVEAETRRARLGAWDRGVDSDVEGMRRAHSRAARILELSSPRGDREALAAAVGVGGNPDERLLDTGDRVIDACERLRSGLAEIERISSDRRQKGLEELPIGEIAELIGRLAPVITELDGHFDELTNGLIEAGPSLVELCQAGTRIDAINKATATIEKNESRWRELFGLEYRGADSDWQAMNATAEWIGRLCRLYPDGIGAALRQRLIENGDGAAWPDFADLESGMSAVRRGMATLARDFDHDRAARLKGMSEEGEVDAILDLARRLLDTIDSLPRWAEFKASEAKIEKAGWREYLHGLIEAEVEAEQVELSVRHAYWEILVADALEEHPELAEFKGRSHEHLIEEFRKLDEQSIRSAAARILSRHRARRQAEGDLYADSETVLMREAGKKRQRWSVKRLLQEVGDLAVSLKPCLMMSPLTVSLFLSPEHNFDLVIFDEASQVPPWDAINCIYRGRQLVVAGDSRQLPPTNFFTAQEVDEAEGSDEASEEKFQEVMESILDLCETVLPSQRLRWHYRSRHEHLIAFSNRHFYDNDLVTFPSPDRDAENRGVHFIHVPDGLYDRGRSQTNRIEAARVADRVLEHLEATPDRTIGVVTFNARQRDAVEDALEQMRRERPDLDHFFNGDRLEGLFVKNLESVQGDERDVIIFSIGYGLDEHGKFTMHFGALNGDGGERRLNVAITRAREQIDVVASIRPEQFTLGPNARPGALRLRDYLQFAAEGPSALPKEIEAQGGDFDSPFEKAVAEAVRALGYEVVPQVGAGGFRIDLGVVDPDSPGRFVLGIECDGATYHSTPTARDRDRLRQRVLEGLGWTIHRIWSRDWVRNPRLETDRIRTAIEALRTGPTVT